MTIFQLMYDFSFFSGIVNTGVTEVTIVSNVVQLFGGATSSLTSNLVAFIAFYVLYAKKAFDIQRHYGALLAAVIAVAVLIDFLYILSQSNPAKYNNLADISVLYVYYYIKLTSIAINFILVIWTSVLTRQMNSRNSTSTRTKAEASLNALSVRLFYYPIVQLISRSGCAWYEGQYGFDYHRGQGFTFDPPHTSNEQFSAQLAMAIAMPVASVGYLIIFVTMQPKAYASVHRFFCGIKRVSKTLSTEHHVEMGDEKIEEKIDEEKSTTFSDLHHHENDGVEDDFDETSTVKSFPSEMEPRELFHLSLLDHDHCR